MLKKKMQTTLYLSVVVLLNFLLIGYNNNTYAETVIDINMGLEFETREQKISIGDELPDPSSFIEDVVYKGDRQDLSFSYIDEYDTSEASSKSIQIKISDKNDNEMIFTTKLEVIEEKLETFEANFEESEVDRNGPTTVNEVPLWLTRTSNEILYSDTYLKTEEEILEMLINKNGIEIKRQDTPGKEKVDIVGVKGIKSNQVGSLATIFIALVDGQKQEVRSTTIVYGVELKEEIPTINLSTGETLHLDYNDKGHNSTNPPINETFSGRRLFTNNINKKTGRYAGFKMQWVTDMGGELLDFSRLPNDTLSGHDQMTYPYQLKEGFNQVYLKLTDLDNARYTHVIPMIVFVETPNFKKVISGKHEYAIKITDKESNKFPYLSSKEIIRKSKPEIDNILASKLQFEIWDTKARKKLTDKTPVFKESSITSDTDRGQQDIIVNIPDETQPVRIPYSLLIVANEVIDDFGELSTWDLLDLNDSTATLLNPINDSLLGMTNRGMRNVLNNTHSFTILDKNKKGMVYGGSGREVPATNIGINGEVLYKESDSNNTWRRQVGFSNGPIYNDAKPVNSVARVQTEMNRFINSKYYLKKGNKRLQIMVDNNYKVTYTHLMELKPNLNYNLMFKTYNNSTTSREFIMMELIDTFYYTDKVPINSLGNHSGFYLNPPKESSQNEQMRLTVKLKNNNDTYFSDYQKYHVAYYVTATVNPFGVSGKESRDEAKVDYYAKPLADGTFDSGYALGTHPKQLRLDESISGGYEIFLGKEIDYLKLKLDPSVINIYEDQWQDDFSFESTVTNMPANMRKGVLEYKYPENKVVKQEFDRGASVPSVSVNHQLVRENFPSNLNSVPGTIKKYDIETIAVNKTVGDPLIELPSEEEYFNLNVYNLGAPPIPQTVKKGSSFTKTPGSVINQADAVFMPGNAVKYVYYYKGNEFDEITNASQIGLNLDEVGTQYIEVKMYDETETNSGKERSTIIKVPVIVYEETPPVGVVAEGNDFTIEQTDVDKYWTEKELHNFILKQSAAIGFDMDVIPPSTKDVELKVVNTTLPFEPEAGKDYVANIQAIKGDRKSKEKEIKISVNKKFKATVNYYQWSNGNISERKIVEKLSDGTRKEPIHEDIVSSDKTIQELITDNKKLQAPVSNGYVFSQTDANRTRVTLNSNPTKVIPLTEKVPREDFTINYYYEPTVSLKVPTGINFGVREKKEESKAYGMVPSKIESDNRISIIDTYETSSGTPDWTLYASTEGFFSKQTGVRLLADLELKTPEFATPKSITRESTPLFINNPDFEKNISLVDEDKENGLYIKVAKVQEIGKYNGILKYKLQTAP